MWDLTSHSGFLFSDLELDRNPDAGQVEINIIYLTENRKASGSSILAGTDSGTANTKG